MMVGNVRAQQLLLSGLGHSVPSLSAKILVMLEEGVAYRDGLVILSHNAQPLLPYQRDVLYDEVGIECLINHFHLDDYEKFNSETEAFGKCLAVAQILYEKLREIGCRAKIIISVEGETDATLRFHKVREGQEWLADDLEGYGCAVLVLES